MIEQQGRIVRASDESAWVTIGPRGGCSACDAGQGCGAGLFGRLLQRKPLTVRVANPARLGVGRSVVLGIPELFFLRLVLRLYALPLVAGLAGAVFCHQIGVSYGLGDGVVDLITLTGLVGSAWLAMPGRRVALSEEAIEKRMTLTAAPGAASCAAVSPEPRQ